MKLTTGWLWAYLAILSKAAVMAVPATQQQQQQQQQNVSARRLVFAHYMIVIQPPNGDYTHDIQLAQAAGIDAFAVNYGGWDCDWTVLAKQLGTFYQTAARLNFKIFVSYDTTAVTDPNMMVDISNTYAHHPAQLYVNGKMFLSSFSVDAPAWNWQTDVLDKIQAKVMFIPGTLSQSAVDVAAENVGSGPFTWIHPTDKPKDEAIVDQAFADQRTRSKKVWMAGIAPWFFKRMSPDLNWLHAQDSSIWTDRWLNLLRLKPDFIEIITWNDYGESSYIGPSAPALDATQQAQAACYYANLTHTAFLSMSRYFIQAYKGGASAPIITPKDEAVYMFHRLQPAQTNGRADSLPLPVDVNDIKNNVYVVSFLASPATILLNSGGRQFQLRHGPGVQKSTVPFRLGSQTLTMNRPLGNGEILKKTSTPIVGQMSRYQGNVIAV